MHYMPTSRSKIPTKNILGIKNSGQELKNARLKKLWNQKVWPRLPAVDGVLIMMMKIICFAAIIIAEWSARWYWKSKWSNWSSKAPVVRFFNPVLRVCTAFAASFLFLWVYCYKLSRIFFKLNLLVGVCQAKLTKCFAFLPMMLTGLLFLERGTSLEKGL